MIEHTFGIDQSMNGFGITLIGPNFEIISQETFKSNVEENFLEKNIH